MPPTDGGGAELREADTYIARQGSSMSPIVQRAQRDRTQATERRGARVSATARLPRTQPTRRDRKHTKPWRSCTSIDSAARSTYDFERAARHVTSDLQTTPGSHSRSLFAITQNRELWLELTITANLTPAVPHANAVEIG